ncbi:kinase-like protein, partial [Ramicandelaber brevisporus]
INQVYGAPVRLLGAGTGGRVHLHHYGPQQTKVAIKTFTFSSNITLESQYQHVHNEAAITLGLKHPNVVRTYEYVCESSPSTATTTFYAVMEYCRGDLFDLVKDGALPQATVNSLFLQMVAGVHYLHTVHRMAHRDIKLDNLCVADDGSLKIIDFGCARILPLAGGNYTTGICGSDPYLSPEVVADARRLYDPFALDIWSLAIVYLTLASGNFPWEI